MAKKKRMQRLPRMGRVLRCYISCAADVNSYATRLADALRTKDVEVVTKISSSYFRDIDQLLRASKEADVLIFIVSPDALRSTDMPMEIRAASERGQQIISIVFKDVARRRVFPTSPRPTKISLPSFRGRVSRTA